MKEKIVFLQRDEYVDETDFDMGETGKRNVQSGKKTQSLKFNMEKRECDDY